MTIKDNLKEIKDLFYNKIIYDVNNFKMKYDTLYYKSGVYQTIKDYDGYHFRIDYDGDDSPLQLYLIEKNGLTLNREIQLSYFMWFSFSKRKRELKN